MDGIFSRMLHRTLFGRAARRARVCAARAVARFAVPPCFKTPRSEARRSVLTKRYLHLLHAALRVCSDSKSSSPEPTPRGDVAAVAMQSQCRPRATPGRLQRLRASGSREELNPQPVDRRRRPAPPVLPLAPPRPKRSSPGVDAAAQKSHTDCEAQPPELWALICHRGGGGNIARTPRYLHETNADASSRALIQP